MLNRRTLLLATGALTLNQLLMACQRGETAAVRVYLLEGSVPIQILQEFQRRLQQSISFLGREQLADLFELLQTWKNPATKPKSNLPIGSSQPASTADLATLGDYWLTAAIQQQLIQPLPLETFSGWQQLPPRWQQLVRRDQQGQLSETGNLWAAPYRWGSLMIAYNIEAFKKLGWTPTDWKDLWRPELKGYLSLPDNARTVIGLTLKKLGQSANTNDLNAVPNLAAELQALQQQVKFYSSDAYLQPLLLKDTWITVGWSTEVLPLAKRDRRIAAVVPSSGTLLTADLWVRPAGSTSSEATTELQKWIEFCWQPAIAAQLSLLSLAASPVVVASDRSTLPAALQQNSLLLPPAEVLDRSEFLLPLANTDQYLRQWVTMRQTG